MDDRITLGATSGIIAGSIMGAISLALFTLGICELCIIAIGGGIFTGQLMEGYSFFGMLLSWSIHLALSSVLGIVVALMLKYFGDRYNVLKGAVLLTLVYLINIGMLAPLRGVFPDNQNFFDLFLILLYHILFGGLASYLIVKFQKVSL